MWCYQDSKTIKEAHKFFLIKEGLFTQFRSICITSRGSFEGYENYVPDEPCDMRAGHATFNYCYYTPKTNWNGTKFSNWHSVADAFEEVMETEEMWLNYIATGYKVIGDSNMIEYKKPNKPSELFTQAYAWSRQLGHDGYKLEQEDLEKLITDYRGGIINGKVDVLKGLKFEYSRNLSRATRLVNRVLVYMDFSDSNQVRGIILNSLGASLKGSIHENRARILNDLLYPEALAKTFGYNVKIDHKSKGIVINQDGEEKALSIKAFGRKFGFVKWAEWAVIAEKLKQECDKSVEIKYFNKYEDLREYYTMSSCSGESCMRYEFSSLSLHPCAVYAHDIEDYGHKVQSVAKYVSDDIQLAVLFQEGKATARVMVSTKSKRRGKAFGSGASVLTKMLGYGDSGIKGYVNIIETSDGILMPYIDGHEYVDENDGEIGCGDLTCSETNGLGSEQGVYSDYHDCYLDEDDSAWSDYHDSYIDTTSSDAIYLDFASDWVMGYDIAEEVALEYLSRKASTSELIDFANRV